MASSVPFDELLVERRASSPGQRNVRGSGEDAGRSTTIRCFTIVPWHSSEI